MQKEEKLVGQEGRMEFATQTLRNRKIVPIREAARAFNMSRPTLHERVNGTIHRPCAHAN